MAKQASVKSAKAVVAGKAVKLGSFNGDVVLSELPDGSVRIEVGFKRKDETGRLWTSGISASGANQEAALAALEVEFSKSAPKIRSIASQALSAAAKGKPKKVSTPLAAIDLNVLPIELLRKMAAGRPEIAPDADKETLVKQLNAAREKSIGDTVGAL